MKKTSKHKKGTKHTKHKQLDSHSERPNIRYLLYPNTFEANPKFNQIIYLFNPLNLS